jgi:hypothetical protein
MATEPLDNDGSRVLASGAVWRIPAPGAQRVDPPPDGVSEIDPLQALIELGEHPEYATEGLADQLLAWIAPRPRNPATLTQSRIVPLLGIAADLLSHTAVASADVIGLGATALAQELRMQRTLADRRATLITSSDR